MGCLFMVFEEDFLFFPYGQDADDADGFDKCPVKMIVQRGFDAVQGSESLPPQSPSPSPSKTSGKIGKAEPESRFHSASRRGSSHVKDEVSKGLSSNVGELVRWAIVAHRAGVGNIVWVGWHPGKG